MAFSLLRRAVANVEVIGLLPPGAWRRQRLDARTAAIVVIAPKTGAAGADVDGFYALVGLARSFVVVETVADGRPRRAILVALIARGARSRLRAGRPFEVGLGHGGDEPGHWRATSGNATPRWRG